MIWRISNLLLAAAMPLTGWLLFSGGRDVGASTRSEYGEALIVPAGYAFSIWGLIYAASIAYGVYQALPSQRDSEALARIRPWTAAAFLLTSVWLFAALEQWLWTTFAIIAALFFTLGVALRELYRFGEPLTAARIWLVRAPLSVFWGWVTAATFANLAAAMKFNGLFAGALWEPGWTVALLGFATTIACWATVQMEGNPFYAGAVVWALAAIVSANWGADPNELIAGAAAAGAALLAGLTAAQRRRTRSAVE